jgi:hypothetical protein
MVEHHIRWLGAAEYEPVTWGETTVVQSKTPAPAQNPGQNNPGQNKPGQQKPAQNNPAQNNPAQQNPDGSKPDEKKQFAWHRHPALIAAIPAIFTLLGGVLTVGLGQADVLPNAINPAPPPTTILATSTVTATTTALSTVTETVTETPSPTTPTNGEISVPPAVPGALAITIRIGSNGKIGPNEWRAGSDPGANADVFDDTGRALNRACYPTWTLKRGSTVLQNTRGTACQGNGFTMFSFRDALKTAGKYHLTVSVLTDSGSKATTTTDFTVT